MTLIVRDNPITLAPTSRGKELYLSGEGKWETINQFNYKGEKSHCDYCLSDSYDDERGNCICCGAPRPKTSRPTYEPVIQFQYQSRPMISCTTSFDGNIEWENEQRYR